MIEDEYEDPMRDELEEISDDEELYQIKPAPTEKIDSNNEFDFPEDWLDLDIDFNVAKPPPLVWPSPGKSDRVLESNSTNLLSYFLNIKEHSLVMGKPKEGLRVKNLVHLLEKIQHFYEI